MRKIRVPLDVLEYGKGAASGQKNIDEEEFGRVVTRAVREVIKNELSARQKQFIMLYYYEGLRMAEIAEQTGVNVSTVSRTLARARKNVERNIRYFIDFR